MKRYGVALMFLRAYGRSPCPYVLKHIWPYVLMFLCFRVSGKYHNSRTMKYYFSPYRHRFITIR